VRIVVRCYGDVRDRTGAREVALSLGPAATVGDALARLAERHPDLAPLLDDDGTRLVVTRDGRHLEPTEPLAAGERVGVSTSPMPE
jgi:molybdopterin converting factor small subunit